MGPSGVSTLVRGGLAEEDPVAYAFMDSMELTEAEVTGLQTEIQKAFRLDRGCEDVAQRQPRRGRAVGGGRREGQRGIGGLWTMG